MSLRIASGSTSPRALNTTVTAYPFTMQARIRGATSRDPFGGTVGLYNAGGANCGIQFNSFDGVANMATAYQSNDVSNRLVLGSGANAVVPNTWQVYTARFTDANTFDLHIGTTLHATVYRNEGARTTIMPGTIFVFDFLGNFGDEIDFRDAAIWTGLHTTQNIVDAVTNNYAPNLIRTTELKHSWDLNTTRGGLTDNAGGNANANFVLNGATLEASDGLTTVVYALGGDVTPPTLSATAPTQTAATTTSVTVSLPAGSDNVGVTAAQFQINASTEWQTIAVTGGVITQVQAGSPFVAATGYSFRYRISDAAGNFSATSANTTVTTASAAVALFGRGTFPVAVSPLGTLPAVATVYQMGCSPGWPGTAGAPATVTTTRVAVTVQPTGAFAFPAPFGSVIDTVYTLYGGEWDGVGTTPTGDAVCWSGRYVT